MGVLKPELIFKSIVPIIMAGILGIYGLIVSVILQQKSKFFKMRLSALSLDFDARRLFSNLLNVDPNISYSRCR